MGDTAHQAQVGRGGTPGRPQGSPRPPSPFPCHRAWPSELPRDARLEAGSLEPSPRTYRMGIGGGSWLFSEGAVWVHAPTGRLFSTRTVLTTFQLFTLKTAFRLGRRLQPCYVC